jgi:hypothetical protein
MKHVINTIKLLETLPAVIFIIIGMTLRDNADRMPRLTKKRRRGLQIAGIVIYSIGWIGIFLNFGFKDEFVLGLKSPKWFGMAGAIGAFTTGTLAGIYGEEKNAWTVTIPIFYSLSWVMLAFGTSYGKGLLPICISMIGASLVIAGVMVLIPWQSDRCIVTGPAMSCTAGGWAMLSIVNSMQDK